MIVVMPNGSLPRPANLPARSRPAPRRRPRSAPRWRPLQNRFTDELLKEVVPFVEKNYRVKTGPREPRDRRAVDGRRPDPPGPAHPPRRIRLRGDLGAAVFGGNAEEWEKRNEAFLKDAEQVNKASSCWRSVVGDKDFLLAGSKALAEVLEKRGIKHELHISGGGHTWINWRHYLNELAPKLFH